MLITYNKQHKVQELQDTLKNNYGSEPIRVTAPPPTSTFCETGGNELSPEYEFSFSWSATITRENDTEATKVSFHLENHEYGIHHYGSWVTLANLTDTFTVTGNDVILKQDGTINLPETMLNILNSQKTWVGSIHTPAETIFS